MTTASTLETGYGSATPVGDNLVRRFVHSQVSMLAAFASSAGGEVLTGVDAGGGRTGGPVALLNQVVLLRPVLDRGDGVLDEAEAWLGREAPATLLSAWPTPDLGPRGWSLVGHPALVVRAPGPHDWMLPPGVGVREVGDQADLATAERVAVEGYPLPEAAGRTGAVLPSGIVDGDVTVRLGLIGQEPGGVAASHVAHGVVNLCLAATLPAARRRGVWQSLVWARVAEAPDLPAVAFTSDDSRPGFAAMGFLVVSRCTLWFRPSRH